MDQRHAQRFGDDLAGRRGAQELAAAARGGAGLAAQVGGFFDRDLAMGKADADGLNFARVFAFGGRQGDAAGDENRRAACVGSASASIMAGRPLSQVATPMTPLRVGSERIRRRRTMAASLR